MKNVSGLNQERNLHRSSSVYKTKQSKTALNKDVAGFWCERQQEMHFFTGGRVIMDYELVFELKTSWWWICFSFCLLQMLTDGLEWCGLLVVFLSDSHSDGTHSLQSIHCWDTDAETHFYKPDEETNSSTSFHQVLISGWTNVDNKSGLCYKCCLHIAFI